MRVLVLNVLGKLEFSVNGQPIVAKFRSDKIRALLVYLVLEVGRLHPRRSLAVLLWPDLAERDGLRNLRKSLFHLRESLDRVVPEISQLLLTVDRQTVQFNPNNIDIDALEFEQLLADVEQHDHRHLHNCSECLVRLEKAASYYQGELLSGLAVPDALAFEEWLLFKREKLQQQAILVLQNLATIYEQQGDYGRVEKVASQLMSLDPYHEKAVRQLMRALSYTERRSAALQAYQRLADRLRAEIGVDPEERTTLLWQKIVAGDLFEPAKDKEGHQLRHFPTQFTLFLGRKKELAQITQLLLDDSCRLLTIIGSGGVGKTRLATEAAQQVAANGRFADGVYFVNLATVEKADDLPMALATALALTPRGGAPLRKQLLDFLQAKSCLLLLDNFEQLIDEALLLSDILSAASAVQLLVTSRFALNVRAEQRVLLSGLALPNADESEAEIAATSSVRLFVESARRVAPSFELATHNQTAVIEICQLVGGLPLALEIAGAWMRVMDEAAIAAQIRQDCGFLTTPMKDLPDRHRSMTAVFTYSWNLLSQAEQMALAQLSVFQGGFSLQTAVWVTGASFATLGNLLDYSLLQRTANGRYEMHPLTRQFAQQQLTALAKGSSLEQEVHNRHSDYYLNYLAESSADFHGASPYVTITEVQQRWQNIYHAWQWAISQQRWQAVDKSIDAVGQYCILSGLIYEGSKLFLEASQQLQSYTKLLTETTPELIGRIQLWHGHFLHRQGLVAEALTAVQDVQAVAMEKSLLDLRIKAQRLLVSIKGLQGDYKVAESSLQECIDYYETKEDNQALADVYGSLGHLFWRQGLYPKAITYVKKGLALQRQLDNVAGQARQINILGLIYRQQGDLTKAESCFRQALAIHQPLGYQDGISKCLTNLSIVLRQQGKYKQALAMNLEAERVFQKIGHQEGVALLAGNRGIIQQSLGDFAAADACFEFALQLDERLGNQAGIARHLGNMGYLYHVQKAFAQAMAYYDRAIPILRELGSAYFLTSPLLHKAETLVEQGGYAHAYAFAMEGLKVAQQVARKENIALGHIILARIAYGQGNKEAAWQRLQEQLADAEDDELAAGFHYELWRLGAGVSHAQKATVLYTDLYGRMPDYAYKIRLEELTDHVT